MKKLVMLAVLGFAASVVIRWWRQPQSSWSEQIDDEWRDVSETTYPR